MISKPKNLKVQRIVQVKKSSIIQLVQYFKTYKDRMNQCLQDLYHQSKQLLVEAFPDDEDVEMKEPDG